MSSPTSTNVRSKLILTPRRKLLEARRSEFDFTQARRAYNRARDQFQSVLDRWNNEEFQQMQENKAFLTRAFDFISKKASGYINEAINNTLREWKLGQIETANTEEILGKGPADATTERKGVSWLPLGSAMADF